MFHRTDAQLYRHGPLLDGAYRFTFGITHLTGGINMLAIMLGLYAIKQIVGDFARGQQSLAKVDKLSGHGLGQILVDLKNNISTVIRSFLMGLWIGFLPGMGSGLSNMVAYASAKSASKEGEKFGTGHPGGIWASETSNNASIGGAVIPMIALGIPGDTVTALLLSGLTIHGLQAGPFVHAEQQRPCLSHLRSNNYGRCISANGAVGRHPSFPKTLVLAQQLFVCSHHLYVLCGSIFEYKHHVQCVDDAHYGGIWYAARLL